MCIPRPHSKPLSPTEGRDRGPWGRGRPRPPTARWIPCSRTGYGYRTVIRLVLAAVSVVLPGTLPARGQGVVAYQGRVVVAGAPFEGNGAFKFGIVNAGGTESHWLNAPDGDADGAPDHAVSLPVSRGLYHVNLGDAGLANMAPLPTALFGDRVGGLVAQPLFLRVWFNDGVHGFQRLSPDQRLGAAPFALAAATVADGAVTPAKMAPGTVMSSVLAEDAGLAAAGYVPMAHLPAPPWVTGNAGGLSARYAHAAAWLPRHGQLFLWGGQIAPGTYSGAGALYHPGTDAWQGITDAGAPTARRGATAVRVGDSEVLVWGGFSAAGYLDSGARFHSGTGNWAGVAAVPPGFRGRDGHVAVSFGTRALIWGGRDSQGRLNDGCLYDVSANSWTLLEVEDPPLARAGAVGVWAGDRVLIWGGLPTTSGAGTGSQLVFQMSPVPTPTEWRTMETFQAPSSRSDHVGVWTGSRFLVWGGRNGGTLLGDGASYDPVANTWTPMSGTGAPAARAGHVAAWTGTELVIFGGETASGATSTGGAYDPQRDTWRALTLAGSPVARSGASGTWTGREWIVFGGQAGVTPLAALQRLVPQPDWYLYRKP